MDNQPNNNNNKNKMPKFNLGWIYGIIIAVLIFFWASGNNETAAGMQKEAEQSTI